MELGNFPPNGTADPVHAVQGKGLACMLVKPSMVSSIPSHCYPPTPWDFSPFCKRKPHGGVLSLGVCA